MNRLCSFLGMCRKAGKLTYGANQTTQAAKANEISLVCVAADVSEKTEKEIRFVCHENVRILKLGCTSEEIGYVLGMACRVIGITDDSMAGKIESLAMQELTKEV